MVESYQKVGANTLPLAAVLPYLVALLFAIAQLRRPASAARCQVPIVCETVRAAALILDQARRIVRGSTGSRPLPQWRPAA